MEVEGIDVDAQPSSKGPFRRRAKRFMLTLLSLVVLGLLLPERPLIPVRGATSADWNPQSFWYEPWGTSGVHKGIDIFGSIGTPVLSSTAGVVIYSGELSKGGQVIAVLGPKWRIHYYAHLDRRSATVGQWRWAGETVGTLGTSGNAVGKSPHLHYAILSLLPLPWQATTQTQGWKRMFYVDPTPRFSAARGDS